MAPVTHVVYVVGFLLYDREAGRVRRSTITGLIVVVLLVISHFWLAGPWLQQAGLTGGSP
jgi:hypothetical protein